MPNPLTPPQNPLRPPAAPRRLVELAAVLGPGTPVLGEDGVEVTGLTLDSRQVRPGDLYAALPGTRTHGARFAADAARQGAVAVLTDPAGQELLAARWAADGPAPGPSLLVVPDARPDAARLAAELYRHPAEQLRMLAVTGTNGKTTTVALLAAALTAAGGRPATVGTLGFQLGAESLTGPRTTVTTPEAPDLQALLAAFRARGADAVAMEVSSHALVLGRTEPVVFDVAGFTNLGQDHLDFHADLADYFEAKALLFTPEHTRRAVVCTDTDAGAALVDRRRAAGLEVLSTGLDPRADYHPVRTQVDPGRTTFELVGPGGRSWPVVLGLPGTYNVSNAVLALAMLDQLGLDVAAAAAGLAEAGVPGRMQRVPLPAGSPQVVVDFAHTPQALTACLQSLRAQLVATPGARLLAVYGCGGDRDRAKRGPMGEAGAREADVVVVTDDNPRGEDPATIRAETLAGARAATAPRADLVLDGGDRRSALRRALELAGPDDLVAVLGKGHESGQEVAGVVRPFDDAVVVQELAGHLVGGRGGRRAGTSAG